MTKETCTDKYVIGFAVWNYSVLLIRKTKPTWQVGRLNGVGGKIDPGETPIDAMVREFHEEINIITTKNQWKYFAHLNFPVGAHGGGGAETTYVYDGAHCFVTDLEPLQVSTFEPNKTEERVYIWPISDISLLPDDKQYISNIPFLIAGALLKLDHPQVFFNYKD